MWGKVNELTGKKKSPITVSGIDANTLNVHYSAISTDNHYVSPIRKLTCSADLSWLTPMAILRALETLKTTAAGLDG